MKIFWLFSVLLGSSALMMDAFIAHGLEKFLGSNFTLVAQHSLSTAARYQLLFSVLLIVLSVLWRTTPSLWIILTQTFVLLGIVFFCGSIYLKHLLLWTGIGFFAPIGGVLLMLAFLSLVPIVIFF
ncbi:MAG: DUF423 domain-containing protein [Myxococcales bacterium]|nr:MAG: DUF423 domain-containing protein [Myxococcales bacterium]